MARPAKRARALKTALLSASMLVGGISGMACAADGAAPQAANSDVVVVTGFKKSYADAVRAKKTNIEILHLHAGGVDLGDCVLHALKCLFAFGLAMGKLRNIEERAPIEVDAIGERGKLGVDLFDQLLAFNGSAQ